MKIHYGHLKTNLVADTDSYKHGHAHLINPGLSELDLYGEARIGGVGNYVAFDGLPSIIARELMPGFTKEDIEVAVELSKETHSFNALHTGLWQKTLDKYDGVLPMIIKALPTGTIVEKGNALFTFSTKDADFAKIIGSLEPILMHSWYQTSVLTRIAKIKSSIYPIFAKTNSLPALQFAVHDFGLRGGSCLQQSELGGMSHLIGFNGSDNLRASRGIHATYGVPYPARSVYATEHSVALSFGSGDGELAYVNHILDVVPDDQIASIVIDTYDAHGFIRNVVGNERIKQRILDRAGRVVFRPDSGDIRIIPIEIIELLGEIFGYTYKAGYKVLSGNVGVLQGDGMNENTIPELYTILVNTGWSCDNLVVGSGGGLIIEDLNRDRHRFAIKPSVGMINGVETNFMKRPVTDMTKQSKPGHLKVIKTHTGRYQTISSATSSAGMFNGYVDELRTIYDHGNFYPEKFEDVRANFERHLPLIGVEI